MRYNPTVNTFVTVSGRDIKIWDVNLGCLTNHFRDVVDSDITALTLDDFGRRFFVGTHEGGVSVHNLQDGKMLKQFEAHEAQVTEIMQWQGRNLVLSVSLDGRVHIVSDQFQVRPLP